MIGIGGMRTLSDEEIKNFVKNNKLKKLIETLDDRSDKLDLEFKYADGNIDNRHLKNIRIFLKKWLLEIEEFII